MKHLARFLLILFFLHVFFILITAKKVAKSRSTTTERTVDGPTDSKKNEPVASADADLVAKKLKRIKSKKTSKLKTEPEKKSEQKVSTTINPRTMWGPNKNGTWTKEGVYIETIFKPANCKKFAQKGDYLVTDYIGQFADGVKFDSTYDRNQSMSYRLGDGEVIPGSEIASYGMCQGEVRRSIIPPEQAYGDKDYGQIPAGSTLYFTKTLTELTEDPFKTDAFKVFDMFR